MEKIKANYLIAERILLGLKNSNDITSVLVNDVITFIYEELQRSYLGVCEIVNQLCVSLSNRSIEEIVPDSEDRISNDLLNYIINGILSCLKNGSDIDTSECRKVVKNTADIICYFTKESLSFSKKQIFSYYLESKFKITKSKCLCCNCHKPLLSDIPYCFNCYERNI